MRRAARAGASRIATRASGFPSRIRATCGSSTGSRARTRTHLVLAAILTGMEHEPTRSSSRSRRSTRIAAADRFPKEMLSAVTSMQDHAAVREAGSEFVMVYCENKRQEELDFRNEIGAREYRWFL